jgi:L-threonylcarbamoyladenylate synthase
MAAADRMCSLTRILRIDPAAPDPASIEEAARVLRAGGLVAFPTETVYGLGAHALDAAAVRRIFEAKGRPSTDPLIVHVSDVDAVRAIVSVLPDSAVELAKAFWPGPLTLVLPRAEAVPREVTAGLDTVAVRVPAHPIARALLAAAQIPIAAPSANLFSRPSPTIAAHVLADLADRIDLIIDGGPTDVGVESTVLALTGTRPVILRPGAITESMLRRVIPDVDTAHLTTGESAPSASPGTLAKHYSPRAPLTLYDGPPARVRARIASDAAAATAAGQRVGILVMDEDDLATGRIVRLGSETQPDIVAMRLYAALRDLDGDDVDLILARQFPSDDGLGRAVRDRLSRAAAGRVIRCET